MAHGLDGFAHAAETLTGSAFGARNRAALRQAVKITTLWALTVAAVISLGYAVTGPWLIALMTDIDAVRSTAFAYLPWLIAAPLLSVWGFQLDGIFIGTTHTREMCYAMLLSVLGFLTIMWLLVTLLRLDNHGLWLAFSLLMLLRALTLALFYRRIERSLA